MARSHSRLSRALIAVLAVTVVLGVGIYVYDLRRARAAQAAEGGTAGGAGQAGEEGVSASPDGSTEVTATDGSGAEGPVAPAAPKKVAASPEAVTAAKQQLAEGRELHAAGQLLSAREKLNAALISGALGGSDAKAARKLLNEIGDAVTFSTRRFPDDKHADTFTVPPGGVLAKIADRFDTTAGLLMRVNGLSDPRKLRADAKIKVVKGPFHAVVSKSAFRMDLYLGAPGGEGATFVKSFPVGLGKDSSTPTGTWVVREGEKLVNPKFWGAGDLPAMEPDDPQNPLGEHWIALDGVEGDAVGQQSYGIHGTIDPDSIGKQQSMGCIRLKNEDVAFVYDLLVEGQSKVIVTD